MASQTPSDPALEISSAHSSAVKLAHLHRTRYTAKGLSAIVTNYAVILLCALSAELLPRLLFPDSAAEYTGVGRLHYAQLTTRCISYTCAALIIASRLRAFENLVHEASHHNLFPTVRLHYDLECLYSYCVFRDLADYRRAHLTHHLHLGDPTRDPDVQRLVGLGLDKLPQHPAYYFIGLPATGFLTYEYLTTTFLEFWASPNARAAKSAYWLSVLGGFWYAASLRLLVAYYFVPLLVVLPVTRYWAEASEHLGLDMTGAFGNSRSNNGFWHRWYLHPHNDGYHAVHHLHAQVPFFNLPNVHGMLMRESPVYRSQTVVSRSVIETMRQMAWNSTVFKSK